MFKIESGLYVVAVVGVLAILFLAMLSQGGLPAVFNGDITGDAKRVLMQKNVPKASSGNALAGQGTLMRVPQRSAPTVARAPIRYGDQGGQQEIWEEESDCEDGCWEINDGCLATQGIDDLAAGTDEASCNDDLNHCLDGC